LKIRAQKFKVIVQENLWFLK